MGLNQVVRAVRGEVVQAEIWFLVKLGVRDDLHVLVGIGVHQNRGERKLI